MTAINQGHYFTYFWDPGSLAKAKSRVKSDQATRYQRIKVLNWLTDGPFYHLSQKRIPSTGPKANLQSSGAPTGLVLLVSRKLTGSVQAQGSDACMLGGLR